MTSCAEREANLVPKPRSEKSEKYKMISRGLAIKAGDIFVIGEKKHYKIVMKVQAGLAVYPLWAAATAFRNNL
jgi:hypothetical protein